MSLTEKRMKELRWSCPGFYERHDVIVEIVRVVYDLILGLHGARWTRVTPTAALGNVRLCDLSYYESAGYTHEELVYMAVWSLTVPNAIDWKVAKIPVDVKIQKVSTGGFIEITW